MRFIKSTIGKIALEIKTGKTPPTSNSEYFGDELNWYTPTDLDQEKILGNSKRRITQKALNDKKVVVLKPNTVLLGCIGNIGKIGLIKDFASSNQQITGILSKEELVNSDYLYYWLKHNKNRLKDTSTRAIVPILNNKQLSTVKIEFPENVDDQIIIAEILTQAENLISKRKDSIILLDELLKSIFVDKFIKKEYPIVKLQDITLKITDGEHAKPNYLETGMPFISVKNISKGSLDFTDCKFVSNNDHIKFNKRCNPEFEDIIYTKVGATYGRAVIVNTSEPFSLYVSVALIKPDKTKVNPYFLNAAINHPFVKRQADKSIKGAGVPDLHLIEIKSFKIPFPPIEKQIEFATIVEKIEGLRKEYEASLKELENMYGVLSQKAFKGELNLSKVNLDIYKEEIKTPVAGSLEPSDEEIKIPELTKKEIKELKKLKEKSKDKIDITDLSISDFYGVPIDIQAKRENIDFDFVGDDLFYQFLLKDHFRKETFTSVTLYEKLHNYFYHIGNMDFDNKRIKKIIFDFLDAKPPLLEQFFDDSDKTIKLKLTDEAFKA